MNHVHMMPFSPKILCVLLTITILTVDAAFYSATNPTTLPLGKNVTIQTVKLTSIPMALPYRFYEYHNKRLPFCTPGNQPELPKRESVDIGQQLSGDYITKSAYNVSANINFTCTTLCTMRTSTEQYTHLRDLIKGEYRGQLLLDELPIAVVSTSEHVHMDLGFPIGYISSSRYFLNNFLALTVNYTKEMNATKNGYNYYITGFTVVPYSYDFTDHSCDSHNDYTLLGHDPLDITDASDANSKYESIVWAYNVTWIEDKVTVDRRWDKYWASKETNELHSVSLSYAIIVFVVLTLFLAIVLVRIIRNSTVAKFNFDDVEESGWKTLHGDVFRPPRHFMILSVLVGGGAQLLATAFVVVLLGFLGLLSPARSGSINSAIAITYPFLGFVAGYASARVYTRLGGGRKRRNAVFTAVGFNGLVFLIYIIAAIILASKHSSAAPSASTFFSLLSLFIFVHTPLVFLGAFFAHRRPVGQNPTGTNTIPRMIPPAPWYSHTYLLTPLLAILPYGISFNELYDMLNAMWSHHVYYFFNYVFVIFLLLAFIIAEVSVILCYFQLANENYHWWWHAFYIPGTVVLYIFLTTMFYVGMILKLDNAAPVFLYLCYTTIMLLAFFVFMSSIAFYACWTFVHKIYSTIHVD